MKTARRRLNHVDRSEFSIRARFGIIAAFWLVAVASLPLRADDAAALLPKTTIAYVELPKTGELLDAVLDHPIRARLEQLQSVQDAYEGKEYLQFKAAVAAVEAQIGKPWRKIVASATDGGVCLGIDGPTQGGVLLFRASDPAEATRLVDTLLALAGADAKSKGNPAPYQSADRRGVKMYTNDGGCVAPFGPWIVATNKPALAEQAIDAWMDKGTGANSLAGNDRFAAARAARPADAHLWGFVDLEAIRASGTAKQLVEGRTDNPGAELLFGGIASSLSKTPYATVAARLNNERASVEFAIPHDTAWAGDSREFFFGPQGAGAAPPMLHVPGELLSLSAYRDISAMWLRAGDLFDENVNDELAKAESTLATFFSGKDFGEEILGAFGPEVQAIVARQTFAEGRPRPAIKLPAFALAFRLKDPATMQPELRRTFQSLIGFLNVIGAMNGQPQLDLDIDKTDSSQIVFARYLPDASDKNLLNLKIHHNFSPSVAFAGDRFILSSTKELAEQLVTIEPERNAESAKDSDANADGTANPSAVTNTSLRADFSGLAEILADNRGQLVAQNMLNEGNTKDEAEREIDGVLNLLTAVKDGALRLERRDGQLRLSLQVGFSAGSN